MKTTNNLPKIISVFSFNDGNKNNNEASYFLGCNLSKRYSSKVLFVDCDCGLHLSSLFFGDEFNDYYQCEENSTIYEGLKPVIYSLP